MITRARIEKDLADCDYCAMCYGFEYKNKHCGIDPNGENCLTMWYGDTDYIAHSIDDIFFVKLYDGKTLEEILPDIEDYGIR